MLKNLVLYLITLIAAGPHIWGICKEKVTIIVSPLLTLEEEIVSRYI